jgi:hypothetical protein
MHAGLDLTVDSLGECRIDSPLAGLVTLATHHRNTVDPQGDLWLSVLEATGQPLRIG